MKNNITMTKLFKLRGPIKYWASTLENIRNILNEHDFSLIEVKGNDQHQKRPQPKEDFILKMQREKQEFEKSQKDQIETLIFKKLKLKDRIDITDDFFITIYYSELKDIIKIKKDSYLETLVINLMKTHKFGKIRLNNKTCFLYNPKLFYENKVEEKDENNSK